MKSFPCLLLSSMLIFCAAISLRAAPRADLIAKVKSGEIKEAYASWWGFSADDGTKCLQDAINSKVPRLIIDNLPNAWNIDPIRFVSNQEIVIEEGAKINAKRNSFQSSSDRLFTFAGISNVTVRSSGATIRMYREDYANPPYNFSAVGGRHAFYILGSSNILIDGITIRDCGGDAFYLDSYQGRFDRPCRNIRIRNCTIDKPCRRGLFVSSTVDSSFENISIKEAIGTWPYMGVSIYSDRAENLLQRLTFKNLSIQSCKGYAIGIALDGNRDEKAVPISMIFESCSASACDVGLRYSGGSNKRKYPRGKIVLNNCNFSAMRRHAVKISQKPLGSVAIEFNGGKFYECCTASPSAADIDLATGRNDDFPVDAIVFNGVEIHQGDAKRNWLSKISGNWMSEEVRAISGKVSVHSKTTKKLIVLDNLWRKAHFPPKSKGLTPPRVPFIPDVQKCSFTDLAKGGRVSLTPLKIRGSARYVIFVDKPRTVRLGARYVPISKQRSKKPIVICRYGEEASKAVASIPLPDFYEKGDRDSEVSFDIPAAGFYSIDISVGHNAFLFTSADVPIAADISAAPLSAMGEECTFYFPPARGKQFAVFVCGSIAFEVAQPNGVIKLQGEKLRDWSRFLGAAQGLNDLWSIRVFKPHGSSIGDYQLDLTGMPGLLFLSNQKFWRVR